MRESDKVRSTQKGKATLRKAYKDAQLTQEQLANKAKVSVDTVKRGSEALNLVLMEWKDGQ